MLEFCDLPKDIEGALRSITVRLPETDEKLTPWGLRWRVRQRTFAHALALSDEAVLTVVVTFRSASPEREALIAFGDPFFEPGWGNDVVGMALTGDVDWAEVDELLTESYCILAPKKLVRLVTRPRP